MQRSRKGSLVAVAALAALAVGVDAFGGQAAQSATTRVTVTAGKPSEFRFTLSKRTVTTGTVVFTVRNRGKIRHDFRIRGKKTASLRPGKAGTLRVAFTKPGRYQFVCTLPGHAAAGMKGTLTVKKAPTRVSVTAGKPSEFRFRLSKRTVTTGTVVFRVVNRGKIRHDFRIRGKKTASLRPGKAGTLRVTFTKPGKYRFVCTLPGHAAAGMKGTLTVRKPSTPVTVTAGRPSELRFRLSKATVPRGTVTFTVVNRGKIRHDFKILGKKTKSLAAGRRQKLSVTFRRAGRYRYVCTLPGHASAGMRGTLRVT